MLCSTIGHKDPTTTWQDFGDTNDTTATWNQTTTKCKVHKMY
jgi:hypothetical protein